MTNGRRVGALACAALAAVALAGCSGHSSPAASPTSPARSATSSLRNSPSATATRTPSPAPTPAQLRQRARATIARIERQQPAGAVSVAATNTHTGSSFAEGQRSGMWTASAYKLLVLETLLTHTQGPGTTGLSSSEQSLAIPMIEQSDNVAGYSLFLAAGGRPALVTALQKFGMRHSVAGVSDPTFTTTSGSDALHLLQNLVGPGPLNSASRGYVLHLMRSVESDQRWGVGAAADHGTSFANKNGWLSIGDDNDGGDHDEDDGGLWAVTSLGVVRIHHQQVLMAIMTKHQPSFAAGVRLVQQLARTAAPAVSPAG